MPSRLRFSLGLFTTFISLWSQSTEATWATSFSASYTALPSSTATDSSGNVFVTGQFGGGGTMTLGSNTLPFNGETDIYVAKLDPAGSVLWAVSFGDLIDDWATGITVDSAGDAIVVGNLDSLTSLVISPSITLTQQGSSGTGMVAVKLDGITGQAVWARNFGGDGFTHARGVVTDSSRNVYVAGSTGSSSLVMDSITLTNTNGPLNGLFFKLDGSTGAVSWAEIVASSSEATLDAIAVDPSDNIYISGKYRASTLTVGTTTLSNADTSGNTDDVLLLKVASSNGALLWAQSFGGTSYEYHSFMAADRLGNIYISFEYDSPTLVMGATTITAPSSGSGLVVAKVDASTGVPTWAVQFTNGATALAVDPTDSNLYVAGSFRATTLAVGAFTLTNSDAIYGYNDIFLAKLDKTTGTALTAVSYGDSSGGDYVNAMCVDSTGATTLVGYFEGNSGVTTLTFNGVTLTLQANEDTYVARVTGESITSSSAAASKSSSSSAPLSDLGIGLLVAGLLLAVMLAVFGNIYIKRKRGNKELPTPTLEVMPTRH